ncbi:MAG TPA: DAK2 domain-containing protein [Jiangellaceae bacterium]|nr:DAK2 domain-containing protein [Jiangellaceae bacterium]
MTREPVLDERVALRWCQAALEALAEAREEIDALNVYPVPDGDTGTNLYLTMEAATQAAEAAAAREDATLAEVMAAAARGALLGARGNSGVIMAQMLRGVSAVFASSAHGSDAEALVAALDRAARDGYAAVAKPVEGTILTVARAAAEAASAAMDDRPSLPVVALAAARGAREALERTPDQLDVLKQAGVVDAGGRGLTVVLDAFDTVLTGRRPLPRPRELTAHGVPEVTFMVPEAAPAGPAYEVMYLLDADEAAIPTLRAALEPLGDSLVVVGGGTGDAGLWNVHVHVDDPGAALEAGIAAGRPHQIRVTYLAAETPAPARTGRALVAFAAGDGLAELFESAGARVVRPPVGRRPSTAEILEAIRHCGVEEVVLLPNDRDGIPVAEAAAAEARSHGLRVAVIPTTVQVQGLAAAAMHEPGRAFDTDVVAMTTAAGHTRHGAVTIAAREAVTSAGVCQPGDVLGVVEGDFAIIGSDLAGVATEVVRRMLAVGGELVTLVTGQDADNSLADTVGVVVHAEHPEVDTVVYAGGQARYPLLIGVE